MTWKVYKYDGHYIQGELISKHTTESAAMKSAKKSFEADILNDFKVIHIESFT